MLKLSSGPHLRIIHGSGLARVYGLQYVAVELQQRISDLGNSAATFKQRVCFFSCRLQASSVSEQIISAT